mmetsp:Transcript_29223/g.26615  ORF Transcript_29223/g.26615 Transcript_29223/m.26615 type:complete len:101 (+) Transcript_29223:2254-2556(+)
MCKSCPLSTQIYDTTTQECISCPANSFYQRSSDSCVCYNNAIFENGQCNPCGVGEVAFPSPTDGECRPCSEVFEPNSYFDISSNSCKECEDHQIFNLSSG